jgi:hypothetical protein
MSLARAGGVSRPSRADRPLKKRMAMMAYQSILIRRTVSRARTGIASFTGSK